jgi:uncharacterized membrane protein YfcA
MMLLAAAAALAAGVVSSAAGFGFALVLSPALFATLDPYEAVTSLLMLGVVLSLLNLFEGGGAEEVRWRAIAPALGAALPGLGLGVAVLELLSKPALQVAVGVVVTSVGLAQLRAPVAVERREPSVISAGAVGLASGTLATSTGVSGPPLVLWLQAHGFSPLEFRSSLAAIFLGLNLAGAVTVLAAGGTDELAGAWTLALLLALALLGWGLGTRVFRRLEPARFRTLVLALVLAAGAASVAAGVAAW